MYHQISDKTLSSILTTWGGKNTFFKEKCLTPLDLIISQTTLFGPTQHTSFFSHLMILSWSGFTTFLMVCMYIFPSYYLLLHLGSLPIMVWYKLKFDHESHMGLSTKLDWLLIVKWLGLGNHTLHLEAGGSKVLGNIGFLLQNYHIRNQKISILFFCWHMS
jgi:hypothetical protein